MSEYHRVCRFDELIENLPHPVEVDDYEITIIKHAGSVYALLDQCSHEDFPLSQGKVEGGVIRCRAHGAEFDLATGKVLKAPALVGVKTFPVKVEEGDVYVAV